MAHSKVISCSNMKGGTGKTTTVNSLATALVKKGYRVLALDLDPQSNLTIGLGIDPQALTYSLFDALDGARNLALDEILVEKNGLYVAPAHMSMATLEMSLISAYSRETILRRKLAAVRNRFDAILIDCPPSLNILTINALCASDGVIVPIQASSYYALYGLAQLMDAIRDIQSGPNPDLSVTGLLLTMENRTRISVSIIEEVRNQFGEEVFQTVIRQNVKLSEAPAVGKPIFTHAADSQAAEEYMKLAEEVVQRGEIQTRK